MCVNVGSCLRVGVAEHVRMTTDHLVGDAVDDLDQPEATLVRAI
ncbi:MAG: hypothetical protein R3B91_23010 [Planctomycetaceae bacterium]